ncbi:hypothetical protein LTR08_006844 [Meristemomyces frigidus]|nr:hypothetical protein LTR08_006844 [Meristemomyces frigidus]
MAVIGMAGSLSEYFQSAKYSDITIRFGTVEVPAHKIVLVQGSDWFRTIFESGFKEATKSTIELKEDSVKAAFGLLAHLYGLHFNGRDGYWHPHDRTTVFSTDNGMEYVKYQVDLYVAASKYLVPLLCTQIRNEFGVMLEGVLQADGYPVYLEEVTKHIFHTHVDAAAELRNPVVALVASHLTTWADSGDFEQLLLNVPQLGVELIRFVVEHGSPASTIKVAAGQTAASERPRRKRNH